MSAVLLSLLLAAADPVVSAAPTPAAQTATPAPYNPSDFGTGRPEDSPEAIASDSARDLKDNRYYNRPGATRADYDRDWQECRLIARGSRSPAGSYVVVYNPAVISPVAAAGGGIIGSLIASAIQEGEQRRANRRACLMFRGWRLVEVPAEQATAFAALPAGEREAVFNAALGAPDPKGKISIWRNDLAEPDFLKPAAVSETAK